MFTPDNAYANYILLNKFNFNKIAHCLNKYIQIENKLFKENEKTVQC